MILLFNILALFTKCGNLVDILPAPVGEVGYSIAYYPSVFVEAFDETSGLLYTTGEVIKAFTISGNLVIIDA